MLTSTSEIFMPPLSSLSLNPTQPPPAQSYQPPNPTSFYIPPPQQQQQPQPQPIRQSMPSPPAEAHIQSWADNVQQQQPRPMPPIAPVATMQGAWTPDMGIKFSGLPAAPAPGSNAPGGRQGAAKGPGRGTWDPNAGIRFG
jgi:programmed cell death 6-interacting protein